MKFYLISLILFLIAIKIAQCTIHIDIEEYHEAFEKFKLKNNHTYHDDHEELIAFTFFKSNYALIKEVNTNFSEGISTFKTSINANADLGDEFFTGQINNLIEEDDGFAPRADPPRFPKTDLESLNYTELECTTKVVNQGNCGSCFAFAVTAAVEAICCKKHGWVEKISEQQIVDCTFNQNYGNLGCKGGKVSSAFLQILDEGAMSAEDYPYTARDTGSCNFDSERVVQRIKNFMRLPVVSEEYLKNALAAHGPVVVGINASARSFQFYKSGVWFEPNCRTSVNHAVVLVGFGTDDSLPKGSGDYWLFKNSYGVKWGDSGYFKMRRGMGNLCGMLSQIFIAYC